MNRILHVSYSGYTCVEVSLVLTVRHILHNQFSNLVIFTFKELLLRQKQIFPLLRYVLLPRLASLNLRT